MCSTGRTQRKHLHHVMCAPAKTTTLIVFALLQQRISRDLNILTRKALDLAMSMWHARMAGPGPQGRGSPECPLQAGQRSTPNGRSQLTLNPCTPSLMVFPLCQQAWLAFATSLMVVVVLRRPAVAVVVLTQRQILCLMPLHKGKPSQQQLQRPKQLLPSQGRLLVVARVRNRKRTGFVGVVSLWNIWHAHCTSSVVSCPSFCDVESCAIGAFRASFAVARDVAILNVFCSFGYA